MTATVPTTTATSADADAIALIQISGLVEGTFSRVAATHGLTPVQGRLLCVLSERSHGMAELARVFGVGKANLTGLVDRATQRGLVKRAPDPCDRRAVHVVLTEEGERLATAFHNEVVAGLQAHMSRLSPADRAAFHASATTVAGSTGHPASFGRCER